jgi:hypothetical protein
MNHQIAIIIPIYKASLTDFEQIALNKCFAILGHYPIFIIAPNSLNLDPIQLSHYKSQVIRFDDRYFTSIAGYNKLMLSSCFYKTFLDYRYMLIYQLDSYIFSDDLISWCNKGYDYIGGPWLPAQKYEKKSARYKLEFFNFLCRMTSIRAGANRYYQVGNGGFSLRKTETFYQTTLKERKLIDYFLSKTGSLYHEDIFWGVEMPRLYDNFKVPHWEEALAFAFDIRPWLAYKYANNRLSMGCHGWSSKANIHFWEHKIHELTRPKLRTTEHYQTAYITNKGV